MTDKERTGRVERIESFDALVVIELEEEGRSELRLLDIESMIAAGLTKEGQRFSLTETFRSADNERVDFTNIRPLPPERNSEIGEELAEQLRKHETPLPPRRPE